MTNDVVTQAREAAADGYRRRGMGWKADRLLTGGYDDDLEVQAFVAFAARIASTTPHAVGLRDQDQGASSHSEDRACAPDGAEPAAQSQAEPLVPSAEETRLIVADADREKAWLDVSDEALGRFCRWFIIKANKANAERAEATDMPMLSLMAMHAGVALCRFAHDANADTFTTELTQVDSASGPLGDWKITVRRLRAARGMSPGTAETAQQAPGEAGQPGADRHAPNPSGGNNHAD